jgi:DNA-binding transcriptional MocR family regulator
VNISKAEVKQSIIHLREACPAFGEHENSIFRKIKARDALILSLAHDMTSCGAQETREQICRRIEEAQIISRQELFTHD